MSASIRLCVIVLSLAIVGLITPAVTVASSSTTTTLTVSPLSGDSSTEFQISARVTPNPGDGEVKFTMWTAQTGGTGSWLVTIPVNANGVARIADGLIFNPGTTWLQAEYLGNDSFSQSTSTRTGVNVTGIATGLADVSIEWDTAITYWARPVAPTGSDSGALQLVVDEEILASCPIYHSSGAGWCTTTNKTARGTHQVYVRFVPNDIRYGSATSTAWTFVTGDPLPPGVGFIVEGDRFSTRFLEVSVDVAAADGGRDVSEVRLSNSPDVGADGLLTNGTTIAYAPRELWRLAPGADGWRTVYAQLRRDDGSWSHVLSDRIFYDVTPPSGSFVINHDAAKIGDAWGGSYDTQVVSGSVSDNSLGESGAEITHLAVSNDCSHYRVQSYDWSPQAFETDWSIDEDAWGWITADPGVKTICAKWRDAAGNWSVPATDSFEYVARKLVGHVLMDGLTCNDAYAPPHLGNTAIELAIIIDEMPPEGIASLAIYGNNGDAVDELGPALHLDWPTGATSLTLTWSMTDPTYGYTQNDGLRNVGVRLVSNTGRHREIGGLMILDRSVATSGVPVPAFALNSVVSEAAAGDGFGASPASKIVTIATDIQWKSGLTNVRQYDLERLRQGSWTAVALPKPTATKARQSVSEGASNQFRVQATKKSGQKLAWKTGAPFTATVKQDSDPTLIFKGSWRTEARPDALGGSLRTATAKGASVKLTFTGRAIAWVAPRTFNGAALAAVYVDGLFIKNVDLSASSYQARQVVFSMSWKTSANHTIKIVKKYPSWTLPIDALLVLR